MTATVGAQLEGTSSPTRGRREETRVARPQLGRVVEVEVLARGRAEGCAPARRQRLSGPLLVDLARQAGDGFVPFDVREIVGQRVGIAQDPLEDGPAARDQLATEVGEAVVRAAALEEVGGAPEVPAVGCVLLACVRRLRPDDAAKPTPRAGGPSSATGPLGLRRCALPDP